MARNDGRIEKGQRLSSAISAKAWNRAQQAADVVLGVQPGASADGQSYGSAPYQWVYAKNGTGSDLARWGVMAITGVEVTPTSDETADATKQFQQMPVLTGGTPSTSTTAWCVAVEPIKSNSIGRVAVSGAVQVKLDVQSASDSTAGAKDGSRTELKTGSGEALILWKESGTGAGKWGLVRFGGTGAGVRLGTISTTWGKGSTATVTQQNGDGSAITSAPTFTATNYTATLTVSGTMRVACALIGSTWVLVAWDWESLSGYSGTKQQVLTHAANGGLTWLDTTSCT